MRGQRRLSDLNVVTAHDIGLSAATDPELLAWAAEAGRIIVTHDCRTMPGHAADYPGSHVVLRKTKSEPFPFRSLVEAAQLAEFYSQAREIGTAVIHYTERKYVHKVRGGPPGLVRLAEFKSITIEPSVSVTRTDIQE